MKEQSRQLLKQVVETLTSLEEAQSAVIRQKLIHERSVEELLAWADHDGCQDFGYANLVPVGDDVYVVRLESSEGELLDISVCELRDDETRRALISLLEGESSEELTDFVEGGL